MLRRLWSRVDKAIEMLSALWSETIVPKGGSHPLVAHI